MKRTLCVLISLVLALAGFAALCVPTAALSAKWNDYGYYSGTGALDGKMSPSNLFKYADFDFQGDSAVRCFFMCTDRIVRP